MFVLYLFLLTLLLFVFYVKRKQSYWKRRGVFEFDTEFLLGSRRKEATAQESVGEASLKRYQILKDAQQIHGGSYSFLEPIYMPIDPEIIKRIMQKDFSHFMSHGQYHQPRDVISMHLFNLEGEEWKSLRAKLTPTFTSGKIKMMFDTLLEKAVILDKVVENYVKRQEPCDLKEILARYTTDIIGSCAFGFECNSLENPDALFRTYGKMIVKPQPLRFVLVNLLPWKLLQALNIYSSSPKINKFFVKIVRDTIKYRETNNVFRKDFMQLLIELKNNPNAGLTVNQIIAQSFLFFTAGFEASSSSTTFAVYELSQQQDIQDKLRNEILDVLEKHDGKITYDAVMEMSYLDKVFDEALRKYPSVPVIPRMCSKDYKVPGTNVTIEKGTRIELPAWALQMDPDYYPNPEKFNPENFSEENKAKRPDFTYFPFGDGPRLCIGARFGKLQAKIALITLLKNFKIHLNRQTHVPIEMKPASVILVVKDNLWFDVTRL